MPKEEKEALEELSKNPSYQNMLNDTYPREGRVLQEQFDALIVKTRELSLDMDSYKKQFDKYQNDIRRSSLYFKALAIKQKIEKNPDAISVCLEELSKDAKSAEEKLQKASETYTNAKKYFSDCNSVIRDIVRKLRDIASNHPQYWHRRTAMGNFFKTTFLSGEKTSAEGKNYKAPKHIKVLQKRLKDDAKDNFVFLKHTMREFAEMPRSTSRSAKTKEFYHFVENKILVPLIYSYETNLQKFQEASDGLDAFIRRINEWEEKESSEHIKGAKLNKK